MDSQRRPSHIFEMFVEAVVADNYDAFVQHIARIEWAVCDHEIDGIRAFLHAAENNLHAPCDMLARLGIMDDGGGMSHIFRSGWSPFAHAAFDVHPGRPSSRDLWLGVTFLVEWFHTDAMLSKRGQVADVDAVSGDTLDHRHVAWAVQGACALLSKLGLGHWKDDGFFDSGATLDDIEGYWHSRNDAIRRLGGENFLYPGRSKPG